MVYGPWSQNRDPQGEIPQSCKRILASYVYYRDRHLLVCDSGGVHCVTPTSLTSWNLSVLAITLTRQKSRLVRLVKLHYNT